MEVTYLCIEILMNAFFLLSALPGRGFTFKEHDFPIISPNKLQFFEYESVSIRCSEDNDINPWRVMRNLTKKSLTNAPEACSIPTPSCTIGYTFEIHSGEYWCENDEGKQSPALQISVTAGSVILTFDARPVNEGSQVTLHCINKNSNQTQITEFFKDGLHHITNYDNVLTIEKVSKSDEGLYRCSIFGAGDSAESWLAVVKPEKESDEEPESQWTPIMTPLLCTLGLLLPLVIGMLFIKNRKALTDETVDDLNQVTYAVVNKPRKRNGGNAANGQGHNTHASDEERMPEWGVCTALMGRYSSEQEPVYSIVNV